MNDFERRALNGIRAYNLSRGGTRLRDGWTTLMWFTVLEAARLGVGNAAAVLQYYGVAE